MQIQNIVKIKGKVVHGNKDGSKIGFPTANIETNDIVKIKNGVYASYVYIDGVKFNSVTHFGPRTIFDEEDILIEVHILDFDQNIYGKILELTFVEHIRDTIKFKRFEDLINQINKDCDTARRILNN